MAAPTFFGTAGTPADNSTNATLTITITPPLSMVTNDLVLVFCWMRTSSATITNTTTGGQTWTAIPVSSTNSSANATLSVRMFWCTFNGTWGANPIFTYSASTNTNARMIVFRPSSGSNTWAPDPTQTGTWVDRLATDASANTNGWTPTNNKTVNLVCGFSDDDNTWALTSSPNWTQTSLSTQYRNTSGSDASGAMAYQLIDTAAATGICTLAQQTLGPDGGFDFLGIFYEVPPVVFIPQLPYQLNQSVKRASYF